MNHDQHWMQVALAEAQTAAQYNEVPVGAVLVDANNQCLATAHNQPISDHDPSAHAEILCLRRAAKRVENYRLNHTTLYVTLEPCAMCAGALLHARIARLVFAASDPKAGCVMSTCALLDHPSFNHRVAWQGGVLAEPASQLLKAFFQARRCKGIETFIKAP